MPPVYLKNGPHQLRKCQDMFCIFLTLLFFAYYLLHLIYITVDSRDFNLLWTPFDPDDRPCGHNQYKDYHFIYFVSPYADHLDRNVCVKKCPSGTDEEIKKFKLECLPNKVVTTCDANVLPPESNKQVIIYPTVSYGGNLCMPTNATLY